jgi:hypothetical protein
MENLIEITRSHARGFLEVTCEKCSQFDIAEAIGKIMIHDCAHGPPWQNNLHPDQRQDKLHAKTPCRPPSHNHYDPLNCRLDTSSTRPWAHPQMCHVGESKANCRKRTSMIAHHGDGGRVGYPCFEWWHAWRGLRRGWCPQRGRRDMPQRIPCNRLGCIMVVKPIRLLTEEHQWQRIGNEDQTWSPVRSHEPDVGMATFGSRARWTFGNDGSHGEQRFLKDISWWGKCMKAANLTWLISVGLLDTTSWWRRLASSLGGKLLTRGFATSRLYTC